MDSNIDPMPAIQAPVEDWVRDHGDYLFRYARSRVSDASRAEDLVQETLLTAVRRFAEFRGEASARTWLTGILRFKVLQWYRRQAKENRWMEIHQAGHEAWFDPEGHWQVEPAKAGLDWAPDPGLLLERKEFWKVLQACLSELPAKASAAFVQREMEFLEPQTILENLGISESNLWVLLHRARNQLRQCIGKNWGGVKRL